MTYLEEKKMIHNIKNWIYRARVLFKRNALEYIYVSNIEIQAFSLNKTPLWTQAYKNDRSFVFIDNLSNHPFSISIFLYGTFGSAQLFKFRYYFMWKRSYYKSKLSENTIECLILFDQETHTPYLLSCESFPCK